MDPPRQQSPQARNDGTSALLRRDVRVYEKGQLVEVLTAYPIRLMADGRAARHVVDFYEANLLLAYRVRGTDSPRRYRKVIESTSHLVDRNLEGVDQLIADYVGLLRALPTMERNLSDENTSHIVPLNLHQDNQLLKRILRKLKVLGWTDGLWPR